MGAESQTQLFYKSSTHSQQPSHLSGPWLQTLKDVCGFARQDKASLSNGMREDTEAESGLEEELRIPDDSSTKAEA